MILSCMWESMKQTMPNKLMLLTTSLLLKCSTPYMPINIGESTNIL